jgi:hypothetical protein
VPVAVGANLTLTVHEPFAETYVCNMSTEYRNYYTY